IPNYARVVRGAVLSVGARDFVEAARAVGARDRRVMWRHILPNVLAPIIVQATLNVGTAIIDTAGLSFLGLGTQPPTPDWGNMLSAGRSYIIDSPWIATFPGLPILATVLAFNLVGDALRDAFHEQKVRPELLQSQIVPVLLAIGEKVPFIGRPATLPTR